MRRRKKKSGIEEEISYWESSSDMMTGLILVLILVILLLILYLMRIPNRDYIDYFDGEYETESELEEDEEGEEETEAEVENENDDGFHGGAGDGDGDGDGEYPETEEGEYPYEDEGVKSAVHATLVDGETGRPIREEGVRFDLRDSGKKLQILSTYYPTRVSYREFQTTADGTFYLPEKIYQGRYFFRGISEAEGYDVAEDTWFDLDELYDWPEPYEVRIPAYPSRNSIRVRMIDSETDKPVAGGTFEVKAAEDVVTADGTVRYQKGEVVGEIVCDENGYGESDEFFLGEYSLTETSAPEWYAGIVGTISATVEKKTGGEEPELEEKNERTRLTLVLTDELDGKPLEGAVYEISDGTETTTATTDANGKIVLDEVDKDVVLTLTQKSTLEGYSFDGTPERAIVSKTGRFGTQAEKTIEATNRTIRLRIEAVDALLGSPVTDETLTLLSEDGAVEKTWTTTGAPAAFDGIEPGTRYVAVGDENGKQTQIAVEDVAQVQERTIRIWTLKSTLALIGIIAAGCAVIALLVFVIRRLLARKG